MTYINLTNDMDLIVTESSPIYRGDNMSTAITFLLPLKIGEIDTEATTVFLTYIRADGTPDIVILEPEETMYDQYHYKYVMPVTCKFSRYPGEILMWLQFCSGNPSHPEVKKSGECTVRVLASKNLDDCFGDHQLTILYQLKMKVDNCSGGSSNGGGSSTDDPDDPGDSSDQVTSDGMLYYGTGVGDIPEITQDAIVGLTSTKQNPSEGYSFNIDVVAGQQHIIIAYPDTLRDLNNVTYVQANDIGMASNFTKHEVNITSEDGDSANYKVFTYGMAIPAMAAMTFKVTI